MKRFLWLTIACLLIPSWGIAQNHSNIPIDVCASDMPYTYQYFHQGSLQGITYNTPGRHILPNLDTITIIVHQESHTHQNCVVCQGNSFTDFGFYISEEQTALPGIIRDTIHFQTSWGCDSSISLTLTVQPLPDVHVTPHDTVIFGNSANLSLRISGADYYIWEQGGGITAATVNNPTQNVTVTQPTWFIGSGYIPGQDMVINGHFTNGNTGVSSAYSHVSSQGGHALWSEGTYAIGNNASNWHENFQGAHDHTTGNGNYMIINGSGIPGTVVWSQTINIEPYTYYVFNTWVTTVGPSPYANLQFSINGGTIGNIFSAPNTYGAVNTWLNFYHLWYNNSSARTATISIVNQNTATSGNDFGLDDISFWKLNGCGVSDTVQVLFNRYIDTTVCENAFPFTWHGVTFNDTIPQFTIIRKQDSIDDAVTMRVHVHPSVHTTVRDTVYENELPHTYQGIEFNDAITDSLITLTDTLECDSFIHYSLYVRRNSYNHTELTICESQTPYRWRGHALYSSCELTETIPNAQGGDSIMTLNLTVIDTMLRIIQLTDDFCEEMSAMLSVQSGFSDYVWSTGETTPQILVLSPGSYCVTAVSDYCTIDRCISVAPCKLDIKLPNAITPSKLDGHNDYFSIDESQQRLIQDFEISIYNRWSNLVFYSDQKDFKWDGREHLNNTNKHIEANDIYRNNVYSYVIHCTDLRGQRFSFKGSLVVL